MILEKLLSPANLLKTQIFYTYKVIKVIIIYENKYFILIIFSIIMLYLKNFNNSQKLIIISFILCFY